MLDEKIQQLLLELSNKVNEAILNHDFKIINRDEHTITIEACGEIVDIWNANDADSTSLYFVHIQGNHSDQHIYTKGIGAFKKPATCRKILRAETDEEKAIRQKNIENQIAKLTKQLGA